MVETVVSFNAPHMPGLLVMNPPAFSIIIATFNRPRLLARALRSVAAQTCRDWECVVVDDGGNADTAAVVEQFHDSRFRLIRHAANKGAAAASNTGIRAARGNFVSLLDDDDEFAPQFLAKTHALFANAPPRVGFAWTGVRRVRDTPAGATLLHERVWPTVIQPREASLVAATTIGRGFGLTMRRSALDAVGLYDETFRLCIDTEHYFRLVRQFDFRTVPEILVTIHHHASAQLTSRANDALRLDMYGKILERNAAFIAPFPALFDIHHRRLAQLSYALGLKRQGRRIAWELWKNGRGRISLLRDLAGLETLGVDAPAIWHGSRLRKLIARLKGRH